MALVHPWGGYKGEFNKTFGGAETEGVLKTVCCGLSKMLSGFSTILDDVDSVHEAALHIALARFKPEKYHARICKENLQVTGKIGDKIFTGNLKAPDEGTEKVVIKQLHIEGEDIWKARDLLLHLQSDRIETMIGAFFDQGAFFILELTLGGWDKIKKPVPPKTNYRFAVQLLEAVQWVHASNIIHCKIQPKTCLIKSTGNLVLSDFTSAVILKQDYEAVRVEFLAGRKGYNDPEALVSKEVSKLSDIFSVACTVYKMDTGKELSIYQDEMMTPEEIEYRRSSSASFSILFNSERRQIRTPILQRINDSKFHSILRLMVVRREERKCATAVLTSDEHEFLLKVYDLDMERLDICNDPLQSELSVNEREIEFVPLDGEDENDEVMGPVAMGGIYFDNNKLSCLKNLVATEEEVVEYFQANKDRAWLLRNIRPVIKEDSIRRQVQRKLGKRIPAALMNVISRETLKIATSY